MTLVPRSLFTTDTLPERDRFEAWRSLFSAHDLDADPVGFSGSIETVVVGAMALRVMNATPQGPARSRSQIRRDGQDGFILHLSRHAYSVETERGIVEVPAGAVSLNDLSQPYRRSRVPETGSLILALARISLPWLGSYQQLSLIFQLDMYIGQLIHRACFRELASVRSGLMLRKAQMKFDYIVSLGGNCEVSAHIGRYFQIKRRGMFDWWIVPFDSLPRLLNNNFAGLFDHLSVKPEAVYCSKYGIVHQHDFIRNSTEEVVQDRVQDQIPYLKEKYAGILNRLKSDAKPGTRILFIRSWREILHEGPNYPRHLIRGVPRYNFEAVIQAVSEFVPGVEFKCLFVNYGDQTCYDSRALFHNVEDRGDIKDWTGSHLGWDDMFRRFDIEWDMPNR